MHLTLIVMKSDGHNYIHEFGSHTDFIEDECDGLLEKDDVISEVYLDGDELVKSDYEDEDECYDKEDE